jgi:enoyl-CoA hydratase
LLIERARVSTGAILPRRHRPIFRDTVMTESSPILIERPEPGITIIRLNRPEALNAVTPAMISAFHDALDAVDKDAETRVVVLAANGRGFCAGLDLRSVSLQPGGEHHGSIALVALQELYGASAPHMRRIRQPIVAAVNGVTVGVGFALTLAADIRVASRSAKFMVGAVKIGLSAGETGISYHLPRLIGASRAFEIMLTGRPVTAEEAERIGLVSRLAEEDRVLDEAMDVARQIVANSPFASKHTKQIMWTNLDAPSLEAAVQLENHTQVVAMLTADFDEATKAFVEKRAPRFRGI